MPTRLTTNLRDQFISNVMKRVPRVDYESQFNDWAQKTARERLPAVVSAMLEDPKLYSYVNFEEIYIKDWHVFVPCSSDDRGELKKLLRPEGERLGDLSDGQEERIKELRRSLYAQATTCRTIEALEKLFPEFSEYIPRGEQPSQYPLASTLVAEFVKAGWPDGKAPTPAA